MSEFSLYFKLGFRHILDIYSVNYMLLIFALTVVFLPRDWRRITILIATYGVGHSITLWLSVYDIIHVNPVSIDYFISMTVMLSSILNIFKRKEKYYLHRGIQRNYYMAFFFGGVHGLGFSRYFKSIVGADQDALNPLFAFNIGIETGQIIAVWSFVFISYIFVNLIGINRRDWVLVISSAIAGIATTMLFEYRYW